MEMAVGFTDKETEYYLAEGYQLGESVLGRVFVPTEGVELDNGIDGIRIRYEKHPWVERFEMDGIRTARPKRQGYGVKYPKLFVKNLNTIYAGAFDEYRRIETESPESADSVFYEQAVNSFVSKSEDPRFRKMMKKFCGFTENMWRDGNEASYDIAVKLIIPRILGSANTREIFLEAITEEFKEYLAERNII